MATIEAESRADEDEGAVQPVEQKIDRGALARRRETRFQQRKARIEADPLLSAAAKRWYLDRELWDTDRLTAEMTIGKNRVYIMRNPKSPTTGRMRVSRHPSTIPEMDDYGHIRDGVRSGPLVEAGRTREHLVNTGRYELDEETGGLIKSEGSPSHGRPRLARATRSRKGDRVPEQRTTEHRKAS